MSLVDDLYQGRPLPRKIKWQRVMQLLLFFEDRFLTEMQKTHVWLAYGFAAVEAGKWRGQRLAQRRRKLIHIIDYLRVWLGLPLLRPQLGDRWWDTGLYYGFDAVYKYARERSKMSPTQLLVVGFVNAKKLSPHQALRIILEEEGREVIDEPG